MSSHITERMTTEDRSYSSRGVGRRISPPAETPSAPLYAKSRALVIGIDTYRDAANQRLKFADDVYFDDLGNAKNDAKAVAQLLREEFDFDDDDDVVELYDGQATRKVVMGYLQDELPVIAEEDDRLVIFFAGHGITQRGTHTDNVGYLVTSAATQFSEAISMDEIRNVCRTIPAKHILILLDCCFSGSAALTETFPAKPLREGSGYLESLTNKTSWQILTAGRKDEEIADRGEDPNHSAFTSALLSGLRGAADIYHDGVITGNVLGDYVPKRVIAETERFSHRQEPVYRQLLNGEAGNFVFLTPERRLRDEIGQELLAIVHEFNVTLPTLATCFEKVCAAFGRDATSSVSSPASYLSELWDIGAMQDHPSPILFFADTLAKQHPAIGQRCELWRQRALSEPRLALRWSEMFALPPAEGVSEMVPVLTISLDPVDVSPDTSPERNSYKVNVYFWQTQRSVVVDKLWSLSEVKTEVDRVIRGINQKYPQHSTNLAIEFCLPLGLLSTAFEEWPKRKDLMGSVAIGADHPVVVRCIDGLKSASRRPYWQQKWESFKECRHDHPHHMAPAICRRHEYQAGAIYNHYHQSTVHCLGLTETPPTQTGIRTPLTELLEAGIPIAVWPRSAKEGILVEESVHQTLHELLHGGTLDGLPVRVQRARSQAQDGEIARHLTLLWDDYDRIPPLYQTLEEEAFDDLNL